MTITCKRGVDHITCFVDKTSLTIYTDEKCLILSDVESVESSIYAASSSRFLRLSSFSYAICLSILELILFCFFIMCLTFSSSLVPSKFSFFLHLITCNCSCLLLLLVAFGFSNLLLFTHNFFFRISETSFTTRFLLFALLFEFLMSIVGILFDFTL